MTDSEMFAQMQDAIAGYLEARLNADQTTSGIITVLSVLTEMLALVVSTAEPELRETMLTVADQSLRKTVARLIEEREGKISLN